jgi:hypothetical protein
LPSGHHTAAAWRRWRIITRRAIVSTEPALSRQACDCLAATQERIAALLTDQGNPARRGWWSWGVRDRSGY